MVVLEWTGTSLNDANRNGSAANAVAVDDDEGHDYGVSKRMAAYPFLAEHLGLDIAAVTDADGAVDESFVVAESYETLLVFGKDSAWPVDAVAANSRLPARAK